VLYIIIIDKYVMTACNVNTSVTICHIVPFDMNMSAKRHNDIFTIIIIVACESIIINSYVPDISYTVVVFFAISKNTITFIIFKHIILNKINISTLRLFYIYFIYIFIIIFIISFFIYFILIYCRFIIHHKQKHHNFYNI